MKRKNFFVSLLLAGGVIFTSCKKNEPILKPDTKTEVSTEIVRASISGIIVDENENPVVGAMVYIGGHSTQTNQHGVFIIKNSYIPRRAHVKVVKNGYMNGHRVVYTEYGDSENVRMKLLSNTPVGNFQTSTGGTIMTSEGVEIDFPANAITLGSGGNYNGNVNVAAKLIDPTASDISEIIPGNLDAVDSEGEERALASFGMIGVELTGDNGEKLQLGNGQSAEIAIPLSGNMASSAPTTIPLWHFDEEVGIWVEEGSATLVNGKYVGSVSHFSYWNADFPFPLSEVVGCVVDQDGNPIIGAVVKVYDDLNGWFLGSTYTDQNGNYTAQLPGGRNLTVNVSFGSNCGLVAGTLNISSLPINTTGNRLPCITVTIPQQNSITISGSLEDCNGNPTTQGYIVVDGLSWYNRIIYPDSAGNFSYVTTQCQAAPTTLDFYGFDPVTLTESLPITITGNNGVFNVGTIATCNTVDEFMTFTLDNDSTYSYVDSFNIWIFNDTSLNSNVWEISSYDQGFFKLRSQELNSVGSTNAMYVGASHQTNWIYFNDYNPNVTVTYTSIPLNVGDYAEGSFTGTVQTWQGVRNIDGAFRVKRTN